MSGRKVKKPAVSSRVLQQLEQGYKSGSSPQESRRCHMVLLKWEGYTARQVGALTSCCEMTVNNWVNRFISEGMAGLQTKEGQGRKPILTTDDLAVVRQAVEAERQRLSQAKAIIEAESGKRLSQKNAYPFFKSHHCRYKRIRQRVKASCDEAYYASKAAQLGLLEQRSEKGEIDLLYGDEAQVSEEGYVPYGWQFKDENVCIASNRGERMNCFGLLSRNNNFVFKTTQQAITADFVIEELDWLSWHITRHTVIVMDNARVHQNKKVKAIQKIWAEQGLFIFFLPPYCPHLNLIERLWKEVKTRWLSPQDYDKEHCLFYALNRILNAVGKELFIKFSRFQL